MYILYIVWAQGTMLTVMGKYGDLCQLEELHLRNLGMGSLLILLPFSPHVRRLTLKYSLRAEEGAPNITDSLFLKIFERNPFLELERVEIFFSVRRKFEPSVDSAVAGARKIQI